MKFLDLFCGGGGMSYGAYLAISHLKGWNITGVDWKPQKRYPFKFIQGDALDYLAKHGHEYDLIHASPPCQFGSNAMNIRVDTEARRAGHVNLIPQTRELLESIGKPYSIENVVGAREHLRSPLMLCGTMFELKVLRHRLFECNPPIFFAPAMCNHWGTVQDGDFCSVAGMGGAMKKANGERRKEPRTMAAWSAAMGIYWMDRYGLTQSVPPAYGEYVVKELMKAL